jgi:hypothetical protein
MQGFSSSKDKQSANYQPSEKPQKKSLHKAYFERFKIEKYLLSHTGIIHFKVIEQVVVKKNLCEPSC